jgi:3-oxoacyl-[acyl-carrier protein] reductase
MDRQIALVTGSGRRLGRQIALALAENGFDLIINYNKSKASAERTAKDIRKMGRRCVAVKADVTKRAQVQRMIKQTISTFGKIDVLVNNAAIFAPPTDFQNITEQMWDAVLDTNLKASFFCSQEAGTVMMKQRAGKIINIASLGAFQAWPKHIPYCVSKAGVIMLTRVMAKALAPYITVNAVAPGTIVIPHEENDVALLPVAEKIPLKKYGKPGDITEMVVFLAKSADYITGQVVSVDGGVTIP